jgi:hypothetical protein
MSLNPSLACVVGYPDKRDSAFERASRTRSPLGAGALGTLPEWKMAEELLFGEEKSEHVQEA